MPASIGSSSSLGVLKLMPAAVSLTFSSSESSVVSSAFTTVSVLAARPIAVLAGRVAVALNGRRSASGSARSSVTSCSVAVASFWPSPMVNAAGSLKSLGQANPAAL